MPVFSFFRYSQTHGKTLETDGAIIQVEVSVPEALKVHLSKSGLPVPPAQNGWALIDTGARATAVDESIFQALAIAPIDYIPTQTPHGDGRSAVYPAAISFPGMAINDLSMERIIGCNLKWKTSDDKEIIMLLGRDLMRWFLMVYNGLSADIHLAY